MILSAVEIDVIRITCTSVVRRIRLLERQTNPHNKHAKYRYCTLYLLLRNNQVGGTKDRTMIERRTGSTYRDPDGATDCTVRKRTQAWARVDGTGLNWCEPNVVWRGRQWGNNLGALNALGYRIGGDDKNVIL
jgi:hypothetical protein